MKEISYYNERFLSVAMTENQAEQLGRFFARQRGQEDLTFALWLPSSGKRRFTAILQEILWPKDEERILHGNAAFTSDYVLRVLKAAGNNYGIALLHSHLGPGWQGMSKDDIIAERDRLASVVVGQTGYPLLGLTWGTDGAWSARFWAREAKHVYSRLWIPTVRVIGRSMRITFHPELMPQVMSNSLQVATVSVWGEQKQADLARLHVGIVGLGSVGSIVAETLSRLGVSQYTLIDHDIIKDRNLDRTLGATKDDVGKPKVLVTQRLINASHTAEKVDIDPFTDTLLSVDGIRRVLDCDIVFSCVDRPYPRHILNSLSYSHLIPVVDGGVYAKVKNGKLLHADWRTHVIGPGRPCMYCIGALKHADVAMDMAGLLDDPGYIEGLDPESNPLLSRQNVFPFSLSTAAHEVLQFLGVVTGIQRLGGNGPQFYHCYPGEMEVLSLEECQRECELPTLIGKAVEPLGISK